MPSDYARRPAANEYEDGLGPNDHATIRTRLAGTPQATTLVVNTTYGDDDGGASPRLLDLDKGDSSPLGLPSADGGDERVTSPQERHGRQIGRGALGTADTLEGHLRQEKLPSQTLALQALNSDNTGVGYESKEDDGLGGVVDHLRIS